MYKFQVGPMDLDKHSKLPYFMRMHGSVLPRMIVPLLLITSWTTLITCISKLVRECTLTVNMKGAAQLIQ
jgi:putative membrane protein